MVVWYGFEAVTPRQHYSLKRPRSSQSTQRTVSTNKHRCRGGWRGGRVSNYVDTVLRKRATNSISIAIRNTLQHTRCIHIRATTIARLSVLLFTLIRCGQQELDCEIRQNPSAKTHAHTTIDNFLEVSITNFDSHVHWDHRCLALSTLKH